MRALCWACGEMITVMIPRGGDGSAVVFARHKNLGGTHCPNSRMVYEPKPERGRGEEK